MNQGVKDMVMVEYAWSLRREGGGVHKDEKDGEEWQIRRVKAPKK